VATGRSTSRSGVLGAQSTIACIAHSLLKSRAAGLHHSERLFHLGEPEAVRGERRGIDTPGFEQPHQPPHAFRAARAKSRPDRRA